MPMAASASPPTASITFRPPNLCRSSLYPASSSVRRRTLSKPTTLFAFPLLPSNKCKLLAASFSPPLPPIPTQNHTHSPLTGSTRTIATILGVALGLFKLSASEISPISLNLASVLPNPNTLAASKSLVWAAIGVAHFNPTGPPNFASLNPTPFSRRNLPWNLPKPPSIISYPRLLPKIKFAASYSPPPQILTYAQRDAVFRSAGFQPCRGRTYFQPSAPLTPLDLLAALSPAAAASSPSPNPRFPSPPSQQMETPRCLFLTTCSTNAHPKPHSLPSHRAYSNHHDHHRRL